MKPTKYMAWAHDHGHVQIEDSHGGNRELCDSEELYLASEVDPLLEASEEKIRGLEWDVKFLRKRATDEAAEPVELKLSKGGPWLGAARKWAQWRVPGGDTLEWASRELVKIPFVELWDMALAVAVAAIEEDRNTRPGATHRWVPIAECGELRAGRYWALRNGEPVEGILREDGRWRMATMCVVGRNIFSHILSPWMGPLPEARES